MCVCVRETAGVCVSTVVMAVRTHTCVHALIATSTLCYNMSRGPDFQL